MKFECWRDLETSHRTKTAATVTEGFPYTLYVAVHVTNKRRV